MLSFTTVQNVVQKHGIFGLSQAISIPSVNIHLGDFPKENLLQVLTIAKEWALSLIPRAQIQILDQEDKTPLLFLDIPAYQSRSEKSILFYGHFDKQPAGPGWSYPAYQATLEGDHLYGRGTADDCYSFYTAILCAYLCRTNHLSHPPIFGIFETDEEAGSNDLPYWLNKIQNQHHLNPSHLLILDLDGPTTDRLWLTKSTRGILSFYLQIQTLQQPVHSGVAGGVCPSAFRVFRSLLSRLEDRNTGKILVNASHTHIPPHILQALKQTAEIHSSLNFPWMLTTQPEGNNALDRLINSTWAPSLRVLGLDNIPNTNNAIAVIHPKIQAKIAIRLPPDIRAKQLYHNIQELLQKDPPYQCNVTVYQPHISPGFIAKNLDRNWYQIWEQCNQELFGNTTLYTFQGGSIGILQRFEKQFPRAIPLLTGVVSPANQIHGPNEFISISYWSKLIFTISRLLAQGNKNAS